MMRFFALCLCAVAVAGCNFRRDTPDESKVQSFPEWRPAPTLDLPPPQ